jgi:hypothetical protein
MSHKQDQGELVGVAYAKEWVEAEMIHGLLENAGIPSLLRPVGLNVDGPQLGVGLLPHGFGGGPQRVMVHANRAEQARALLAETLVEGEDETWSEIANAKAPEGAGGRKPRGYGLVGAYMRIYLWSLGVFAVAFAVFMLLRAG